MIRLAQAQDGPLIVASNQPTPVEVVRVEFFLGPRLMLLVYADGDSDLMPL